MCGRIKGVEHKLQFSELEEKYTYEGPNGRFVLGSVGALIEGQADAGLDEGAVVNMDPFYIMKILMQGLASAPSSYTNQFLLGKS